MEPNLVALAHTKPHFPVYSTKEIMGAEKFAAGVKFAADALLATYLNLPRETRFVADIQRWIMCQTSFALYFEAKLDPSRGPVTVTSLCDFLKPYEIASKNTIKSFMRQAERYGFVEEYETEDGRHRALQTTVVGEQLLGHYFAIHCGALDTIDGANRVGWVSKNQHYLYHAQPLFVRRLLADRQWHQPPADIANFTRTDAGSNILHELISQITGPMGGRHAKYWIGNVSPTVLAKRSLISPSQVTRLFAKARDNGDIGWERASNRGRCWISASLMRNYRAWQAKKLSAMSHAINVSVLNIDQPEMKC